MTETVCGCQPARLRASGCFFVVAAAAIVVAGFLAAGFAHDPQRKLVWLVAYLVLVVGVAQAVLGWGRACSGMRPSSRHTCHRECLIFNVGNAGVILGTLCDSVALVLAGTLVFLVAMLRSLLASRGAEGGWPLLAYRVFLALLVTGALTGLVLSALRNLA